MFAAINKNNILKYSSLIVHYCSPLYQRMIEKYPNKILLADLLQNQEDNKPTYFLKLTVRNDNNNFVSIKETAKLWSIKTSLFVTKCSPLNNSCPHKDSLKPDFYSRLSPIADAIFVREKLLRRKIIATFLEFQRKTVANKN